MRRLAASPPNGILLQGLELVPEHLMRQIAGMTASCVMAVVALTSSCRQLSMLQLIPMLQLRAVSPSVLPALCKIDKKRYEIHGVRLRVSSDKSHTPPALLEEYGHQISSLELDSCTYINLQALHGCRSLHTLTIRGCHKLRDLSGLEVCAPQLHSLLIDTNSTLRLSDISVLQSAQSLRSLQIKGSGSIVADLR